MAQLKKKDKLYYARILPRVGVFEVCEIIVRTVTDTWFAGIDKRDKRAYLFSYSDIGKTVFYERETALRNVIDAEEKAPKISFETETYKES